MLLEITSRCEAPCADCPPARADAGEVDLDLEVLRGALPALRRLGVSTLTLIGGEPILHPRFDELLELLCRGGYRPGLRSHGWRVPEYLAQLAPHRERIAHVVLTLRAHDAPTHDAGSAVPGGFARIVEAIEAYRAAGYAVTVDHLVTRHNLGQLVALGELLAGRAITLQLRAPVPAPPDAEAAWHASPDAGSIVMPQIHALKKLLDERIVLEPSVGFNQTYNFCTNFARMDKVLLRANGEVLFCHLCRGGDRSGVLGDLAEEELGAILGRHPGRVGAIWSARLAVIASEPPAITNNCTSCQESLRATAAPPRAAR